MSENWKKLGLVFQPGAHTDWVNSHAWIPTPDPLGDGRFRVYFAGRNSDNLSQVGAFTLNVEEPGNILDVTTEPLISLGPLGAFDDSAVLPAWILDHGGKKFLYYVAWMQGRRVPYYASIGLAVSEDKGRSFQKQTQGPLLNRNEIDPLFTAAPCVRVENGRWRMWYTTNTEWRMTEKEPLPKYHIKYAESDDGWLWERRGIIAIDFKNEDEYAISRPWVVYEAGRYRMWYAYRGDAYRIGYAESDDGISWTRMDDKAGIDVTPGAFDSEMIEYAAVVENNGRKYMFYNGNNFGENGIGLAVAT
jgi:predicted GH43/DUF377 family glycosyl hydrolase